MSSPNSKQELTQSVIVALRGLDLELDLMNQAVGQVTGLNRTDAQCLDIISREGPVTPGALAHRLGLTPGAVTTSIDRLEADGWVIRRHDHEDRRRVLVELTKTKPRQFRTIFRGLQQGTAELAQAYSVEQLELIVEFLGRIEARISAYRKSLKSSGSRA